MSRDKEKGLFKFFKKSTQASLITTREFILTDTILRDLGKDSPVHTRLKTMKELADHVVATRLEANGVEKLWYCVHDLFLKDYSVEIRHATFAFLQAVIKHQFENIDLMRAQFFRFIKHHDNPEDLAQRIDLLCTLTNDGKDVEHFEEQIGPFLLSILGDVYKIGKLKEYLKMIDNVIKFNSPHLDEAIMTDYIQQFCILCCNSHQYDIIILSHQLLGTVIAYSILPKASLQLFVGTLCRTVTMSRYTQESWRVMKNLLGTHMGHSTIYTLCNFLQETNLRNEVELYRGCISFIYMALWNKSPMPNLCCPYNSILPSILQAVQSNHPTVMYEAMVAIQHLVNNHGTDLYEVTMTTVLNIILYVKKQIDKHPTDTPNNQTFIMLHDILNAIEELIANVQYKGSINQFYDVIHECANDRPESSVLKLIDHTYWNIKLQHHSWMQNLYNLMSSYFKSSVRTSIRLKVLEILTDVIQLNRPYEDELINRVIIPHTQQISNDDNIIVRAAVVKLLVSLCKDYTNTICLDLLEILERILMKPFERYNNDNYPINELEFSDINVLIPGLIELFSKKIHRLPLTPAIKIYKMFNQFIDKHQANPAILHKFSLSRLMIYECFLRMRADSNYRLGFPDTEFGRVRYSSFICVTYNKTQDPPTPQSPTLNQHNYITYLDLEDLFKHILNALLNEKDWKVLQFILKELPKVLQNKSFVLGKSGNIEVNHLVTILCSMVQEKNFPLPESSQNMKITRIDLQNAVVIVLSHLASYSNILSLQTQTVIIDTLKMFAGSDPKSSKPSINALTICTVDMRDVMTKLLPEVLLKLSKISATNYIAMPILEFLSTLSQLPTVFGNFVGDQYMAVFAIALPYTNPFKYNHYIVSLAYHVISVWFLKCRLPFRKDFVKFIVSGLQTNVMVPFQELSQFKLSLAQMNQDSSDRKRSSSLTEHSSRRRNRLDSKKAPPIIKTPRDKTVLTFYEELNETCIDLMARYTYSPCSALPKRFPTAEFLLNGGTSKSWMIGNKLITVTTSGCTEKVLKHGVCDKCWTLCSSINNSKIARFARSNSSNEEKEQVSFLQRQNSFDKDDQKIFDIPQINDEKCSGKSAICACWCQGWAEILIRRPTGNVSWVMRIQNQVSFKQIVFDFPLDEMATLYMPSLYCEPNSVISIEEQEETEAIEDITNIGPSSMPGSPTKPTLSRQSSKDEEDDGDFIYDDGSRSRNPVRRSNSSPEMGNWKNPFAHQKLNKEIDDDDDDDNKKKTLFTKDIRVSCEAIPEEISGTGTTPPNNEQNQEGGTHHPALLTCHSYPGSSPPNDNNASSKPYRTVPTSPNTQTTFQDNEKLDRPNNLPNLRTLTPLVSKPPQSPTQTSPRLSRHMSVDNNPIQKSSSSSVIEKKKNDLNSSQKRDRVHTISVMSTSSSGGRKPTAEKMRQPSKVPKEILKSGLNPSFVFLQLYHTASFGNTNEIPLYVHRTAAIDRAINILDKMYPYETHKIGVIYIQDGQTKESEILNNLFGSVRYWEFLQGLGNLMKLSDVDPHMVFLGGLDQSGRNGDYFFIHQDDLVMMTFHIATMMPNKLNDPNGHTKKTHIGNDNVIIVYNDRDDDYDINTIKSQVTLAYIIVQPLDYNSNRVVIKAKPELLDIIGQRESITVSNQSVSILVRQLALHADLAATVLNSLRSHATDPYASNWLERLRKLKNLREKVVSEIRKQKDAQKGFSEVKDVAEDFTDFT